MARNEAPKRTSTGLYQITYHPIKGLAIRSPVGGLTGEYFGVNTPENHARAVEVLNLYNSEGPLAVQRWKAGRMREHYLAKQLGRDPTDAEVERARLVQEATAGARAALGRVHDQLIAGQADQAKLELIMVQGALERLLEIADQG